MCGAPVIVLKNGNKPTLFQLVMHETAIYDAF